LKTTLRKRKEFGLPTWLLLLDIKAAFDRVPRDLLWECLRRCGVNPKLTRMIEAMYTDRTAELAIDGATATLQVSGGTCQGALLAPRLFSYFIYVIFEIWMQKNRACSTSLDYTGSPLHTDRKSSVTFFLSLFNVADDTAVIFRSRGELQTHGLGLIDLLADFGMDCHKATANSIAAGESPKTAIIYITPQGQNKHLAVDRSPMPAGPDQFIPCVESYTYLGALLHHTLSDEPEIQQRMQKANGYFGFLRQRILASRTTHRSTKKLLFESMVMAILLYGSESWIITKNMERQLTSLHRRFVRAMSGVNMFTTRKHKIRAADLEKRLGIKSMRDYLDARILGYAGHMARMPPSRLPHMIFFSTCKGSRPVGAPPLNYERQLRAICKRKGHPRHSSWLNTAADREKWRTFTHTPTPCTLRPYHDYTGRRIQKVIGNQTHGGTVLGEGIFESIPKWVIRLDNDKIIFHTDRTMELAALSELDPIEFNKTTLADPQHLIGHQVRKEFNGKMHFGIINDTDKSRQGNQIWGVQYHDGDWSDYDVQEIRSIILDYKTPPPLLNKQITKIFGGTMHQGTIIEFDHDTKNNQNLWRIQYEDDDFEDLNLSELLNVNVH
jgi:hypothetical protein